MGADYILSIDNWFLKKNLRLYRMTTSSNGDSFRVTVHFCGEFTDPRWIPRTHRPVTRSFDVFFDLRLSKRLSVWVNGWANNREAGDLKRHSAHYDVIVVVSSTVCHKHTTWCAHIATGSCLHGQKPRYASHIPSFIDAWASSQARKSAI